MASTINAGRGYAGMGRSRILARRPPYLVRFAKLGPPAEEFIRRFLLHVLPKGFMRIRHYGLLANRHCTEHLAACRAALEAPTPAPREAEIVEVFLVRVLGTDANRCPHCG